VQVSLPKPKRAAPTAKKKEDLVKQVAAVTHANKERMKALQMASGHPRAMVDDSESSDDGALEPLDHHVSCLWRRARAPRWCCRAVFDVVRVRFAEYDNFEYNPPPPPAPYTGRP
jgi:hypothetical protein